MDNQSNLDLMQILDDSWNNQDWETFKKCHAENTIVRWTGRTDPTKGRHDHYLESVEFFKTFPDNRVGNRPYRMTIEQGDWTCSIAKFTGTMKGTLKTPDGKEIPPTNKSFDIELCTVARWENSQIVEENLFYDLPTMMKQIGAA